jgi:hypothetical protein
MQGLRLLLAVLVQFKNDVIYNKLHMHAWKKKNRSVRTCKSLPTQYSGGLLCHNCSPISAGYMMSDSLSGSESLDTQD